LSVLGTSGGLKGCAARTGKPASALGPAARAQPGAMVLFRSGPVRGTSLSGRNRDFSIGTDTVFTEASISLSDAHGMIAVNAHTKTGATAELCLPADLKMIRGTANKGGNKWKGRGIRGRAESVITQRATA
jgi:hypothetical protein